MRAVRRLLNRPSRRNLVAALERIAATGCERSTVGWCWDKSWLSLDCPYYVDRVCDACAARAALECADVCGLAQETRETT